MFLNKIKKSDKTIYIWLFLIALIVVISSSYAPFNLRRMHVDSSVYVTIAQKIIDGFLPYKDFIDNKGPLAYLISVPGLFLGGFTGIWITELIFMFISVVFAWKIAIMFGDKFISLLGTIFSFVALFVFFSINAGTEEYALPFLMISLYIFTKYYFSIERQISFFELVLLGVCFSCAVMLKLNMFPLWAGFCLVIFIESILKKQFITLLKYICGFCTGIIIVFVPVFLYLGINGIINDFWNLVVLGGAERGFDAGGLKQFAKNFYVVINRNYSFLPLFFGIYMIITKYKLADFTYWIGFTFSYGLSVLFLSFSSGDGHYNMVLIPYYVIAITFLIGKINFNFLKDNIKNKVLVIFLCIVFSESLVNYVYDISKFFFDDSGKMLINAGKIIDQNTKDGDTIISLGFNGYIYPFTKRNIASKYLYQGSGLNHIPGAPQEFITEVLKNKPSIIALFTAEDGNWYGQYMENWHKPIFEMMEKKYRLLSNDNGFELYKLTGE
jgi:hypothetical protein